MSSRAIPPAASPACKASPTSRSFRYRSAQSKCRNPASTAPLVALIVVAASAIRVPNPSAGIWPAPWLSGILVFRKSEGSSMITPRQYLASSITFRIRGRPDLSRSLRDILGPLAAYRDLFDDGGLLVVIAVTNPSWL